MGGARGSAGGVGVVGRGPYGYQSYFSLPGGAAHVDWHGSSYWRNGWSWYQPYYYGDTLYYGVCQPPVGWVVPDDYVAELLENAAVSTILTAGADNQTYYYYQVAFGFLAVATFFAFAFKAPGSAA